MIGLKGQGILDLTNTRGIRKLELRGEYIQRGSGYYREWLYNHEMEIQRYLYEKHDIADHKRIRETFLMEPAVGYLTVRDFMKENTEKIQLVLDICTKLGNLCYTLGKKEGGKTAFAAYIAELIHETHPDMEICYVSLHDIPIPPFAVHYEDLQDTPPNSFNVIDELSLLVNARRSVSNENLRFAEALPIARHSQKVIFGISQSSAIADVNLVRLCDALFIKPLSLFQKDTERNIIRHVVKFMEPKKPSETFFTSYAYTGTFTNPLPKCWSDKLSRGFKQFETDEEAIEYGKKLLSLGKSTEKVERYVSQRGYHKSPTYWQDLRTAERAKAKAKKAEAKLKKELAAAKKAKERAAVYKK